MSFRERASGAGFEVALEADSGLLISAFDGNNEMPRSMVDSVAGPRGVVQGEATGEVARETRVVAIGVRLAANDVHEALVLGHGAVENTIRAEQCSALDRRNLESDQTCVADSAGFLCDVGLEKLGDVGPPSPGARFARGFGGTAFARPDSLRKCGSLRGRVQ